MPKQPANPPVAPTSFSDLYEAMQQREAQKQQGGDTQEQKPTSKEVSSPAQQETNDKRRGEPKNKVGFYFTPEEIDLLDDLIPDLKREHRIKAKKNDVVRLAIAMLLQDYQQHGEASFLVLQLQKKPTRGEVEM